MAIIKEIQNDFGNGLSDDWVITHVHFDKKDGLTVHIGHYFSEDARKVNGGREIKTIHVNYTVEEYRAWDFGSYDTSLVDDPWDSSIHPIYILIKEDIASAKQKLENEEELTSREGVLKELINYTDNI